RNCDDCMNVSGWERNGQSMFPSPLGGEGSGVGGGVCIARRRNATQFTPSPLGGEGRLANGLVRRAEPAILPLAPGATGMASPDKSTSLTLLERIRGRDEEAWRRLMRLYAPLVERWCGHCGVRGQDADDVRQEVFHAVAVGLDNFRRERKGDTFRGWLRV